MGDNLAIIHTGGRRGATNLKRDARVLIQRHAPRFEPARMFPGLADRERSVTRVQSAERSRPRKVRMSQIHRLTVHGVQIRAFGEVEDAVGDRRPFRLCPFDAQRPDLDRCTRIETRAIGQLHGQRRTGAAHFPAQMQRVVQELLRRRFRRPRHVPGLRRAQYGRQIQLGAREPGARRIREGREATGAERERAQLPKIA